MADRATLRLTLTRLVAAPPARAFAAWTDPELVAAWFCPDPKAPVRAEIDLRPGGRYSVRMEPGGQPVTVAGAYREIDPPRRLVFTWDWQEDPHAMNAETVVTVEFSPAGFATEVRLTHEGFPDAANRDGHETGWRISLDRLVALVAGR